MVDGEGFFSQISTLKTVPSDKSYYGTSAEVCVEKIYQTLRQCLTITAEILVIHVRLHCNANEKN